MWHISKRQERKGGKEMNYYFSSDGSYGKVNENEDNIIIVDTTKWKEKDFERISAACDSDRLIEALRINAKYTKNKKRIKK